MTQEGTAVNTPKMGQTTSPRPMSMLKVRPAKCSGEFRLYDMCPFYEIKAMNQWGIRDVSNSVSVRKFECNVV